MLQASLLDGLALDPFAFGEDGLPAATVDVGGRQVAEALMIAGLVVMLDEGCDLPFEILRQIVVFQQDAVLQGLVPALDLALCLRVIGRAANAACPCRRARLRGRPRCMRRRYRSRASADARP